MGPPSGLAQGLAGDAVAAFVLGAGPLLTGPVADLMIGAAPDGVDVAQAAESILDALGVGTQADKTAALFAAVVGMMAAASLVLALCLKIR